MPLQKSVFVTSNLDTDCKLNFRNFPGILIVVTVVVAAIIIIIIIIIIIKIAVNYRVLSTGQVLD